MHAGKSLQVKMCVCVCLEKRATIFSYSVSEIINLFLSLLSFPFASLFSLISTLSSPPSFPFITASTSRRRALWGWGSVMVTMVPGSRYVCSAHAREEDSTNDREERILAVLGIIGTILNLLVVIFVYIYTSVT